jgi:ABC-type branched-subunit amino acid transport system ATPase component
MSQELHMGTSTDATTTIELPHSAGLATQGISVHYGGIRAAHDVTVSAPLGRITGLIGPNGAGKTTTFGACSGLVTPSAGTVSLFGDDITKLSPQARAQRGMGRTFQRMELFESRTVRVNVELGLEAGMAGSRPLQFLRSRKGEAELIHEAAEAALARCNLLHLADQLPVNLSTGQRLLIELARVIAGKFRLLLLDEPSSGLDKSETVVFGQILRDLVAEQGVGILLVEHDMSLVLTICDYIYVLDFGEMIFEGTPADVLASSEVQAAYLGSTTDEGNR